MEVVAAQDVAKELGVLEKMTFGETFDSIRESGNVYNDWKARFDTQDNAKTLSILLDTGNMTGGEDEMMVDKGSVGTGQMGTGKRVLQKGQVRKTPVLEVSISKVATPVSVRTVAWSGY